MKVKNDSMYCVYFTIIDDAIEIININIIIIYSKILMVQNTYKELHSFNYNVNVVCSD